MITSRHLRCYDMVVWHREHQVSNRVACSKHLRRHVVKQVTYQQWHACNLFCDKVVPGYIMFHVHSKRILIWPLTRLNRTDFWKISNYFSIVMPFLGLPFWYVHVETRKIWIHHGYEPVLLLKSAGRLDAGKSD